MTDPAVRVLVAIAFAYIVCTYVFDDDNWFA